MTRWRWYIHSGARALGGLGFIVAKGEGEVLGQSARKLTLSHTGNLAVLRTAECGSMRLLGRTRGGVGGRQLRVDEYGANSSRSAQRRVNVVNREGEKKEKVQREQEMQE